MIKKIKRENKAQDGLECVNLANKNPYRLNEEGKLNLAHDIIEEIFIEDIDKFIRRWGYIRKL